VARYSFLVELIKLKS